MDKDKSYLDNILLKAIKNLEEYLENKDNDFLQKEVISPLEYVIRNDPKNFEANRTHAIVNLYYTNDIISSEKSFFRALKIKPDDPLIYFYLGVISIKKGEFPDAIQYLNKSLKIKKEQPDVLLYLTRLYWVLDAKEEAILRYQDLEDMAKKYKILPMDEQSYFELKKRIENYKKYMRPKSDYPEMEKCRLRFEERFVFDALSVYFEKDPIKIEDEIIETREIYFDMISPKATIEENEAVIHELKFYAQILKNPKSYQLDEISIDRRIKEILDPK